MFWHQRQTNCREGTVVDEKRKREKEKKPLFILKPSRSCKETKEKRKSKRKSKRNSNHDKDARVRVDVVDL